MFFTCPGIPTINYGGQKYNTIAIGDQCWLRDNLNIGIMINGSQNDSDNGIIEKYCYNNDTNNCNIYGGLYQWNEAMQYSTTEGSKGICPTGWHIPTWNEFVTLLTTVCNIENDLLEIGQGSGTNASGLSAFLSGGNSQGNFINMQKYAYYWNSTNYDESNAFYSMLISDNNINEGGAGNKIAGISIRCINNLSITELPVDLTSFIATVQNNKIILKWNTATEINSSTFDIQKKISINNNWQKVATIKASGNSNLPRNYSYIDKNVEPGKYSYRLKMVDFDGTTKYSKIIEVVVNPSVKFELSNAYPNPFNPTTIIHYQIPINTIVTIKLFDVLGKEIEILVNEVKPAGVYEIMLNGKNLSSGTYYYQMKAGNFLETKKLILLK
ncbi:MAG: FISUMP domain-containing protein [Ignavibacteriaceae bacterium]|nr:FISUMP domain-containing protein [Ignavibacteriaceae bacterium]